MQTAQRLGIASPLQANPSIALGTSEVTPLELVGAYAAFANGGVGVIPYVIDQVKTTGGKVIYRRPSGGGLGRVIEPAAAAMMNDMMHNTFVIGTARKSAIAGWETAGKTGTSQEFRDAWFVGYHRLARRGRLARQRRRHADEARLRRQPAGRGLEQLHEGCAEGPAAGALAGRRAVDASRRRRTRSPSPGRARATAWPTPRPRESGWVPPPSGPRKNFLERLFGL